MSGDRAGISLKRVNIDLVRQFGCVSLMKIIFYRSDVLAFAGRISL